MLRAGASDATGLDLATIGHVFAKELGVLVVDEVDVLLAELAVLATRLALFNLPLLSSHVFLYLSSGSPKAANVLERNVLVVHFRIGRILHDGLRGIGVGLRRGIGRCRLLHGRLGLGLGLRLIPALRLVTALRLIATLTLALLTTRREELDLVDNDLDLVALLAVTLPLTLAELALNGDLSALAEEAAERFGTVSEYHAVDVVGIVFPLARLWITTAIVDRYAKGQDGRTSLRGAHLGIAREVSGDINPVDAHSAHYLSSAALLRFHD